MADRRVAITGVGVMSAAGMGIDHLWQTLIDATACTQRIDLFDPANFPCQVGGQLKEFSARQFVPKSYRKAVKVMARDIEIAVAAADLAFADANILTRASGEDMTIAPDRLGCNIGAGLIACDLDELGIAAAQSLTDGKFDIKAWGRDGINSLTPLWLLKYLPNMLSCHITIIHGTEGPSNAITCEAASGLMSVAEGARWIIRDSADAVVAGGAESKLNPMGVLRPSLLGRLCTTCNDTPQTACRPFDKDACGTVVGEGGALIILEEMSHAIDRGASVHAEVVGFASACDPAGINVDEPNAGSLDVAVKAALAHAGICPGQVGLIFTNGTGVPGEDACESDAWKSVFGDKLADIPAVSITGALGSLFAGTSAVSLAVAIKALQTQTVPPTVNHKTPADGCDLNLLSQPVQADIEYAVVGSFTVGGQSAACVLKRYKS